MNVINLLTFSAREIFKKRILDFFIDYSHSKLVPISGYLSRH